MKANQNLSSKERKYLILQRLLNSKHLSYQQLSNEYYVSRSSIANDIASVKQILAEEKVRLTFDNSGTYLTGGEISRQRVLKRLIMDLINDIKTNHFMLSTLLDQSLYEQVAILFRSILRQSQIEVPESYLQDILISTVIVIQRGKENQHIQLGTKRQFGKLFFQFDKYPLVYELLKSIEDNRIYQFSKADFQYLTYVILGNGFKYFMVNSTIPDSFKVKVKQLIVRVGEGVNTDFSQDSRLESDLMVHLYQLVLRLQAHTTVINPVLDEIRKSYRKLFGVVWYALNDFGNDNNLMISADEVGFVTIHFQAALERSKKVRKVLFVCPNGIGTSALISAKLRQILPDITLIEVVSVDKLKQQDLSDVDLIISTVIITDARISYVKISPLMSAEDMKKIMSRYIDITLAQNSREIVSNETSLTPALKMLTGHVFFDDVPNFLTAIEYLQSKNYWKSDERQRAFRESVLKREAVQSTYLGNGFAIPHGKPSLVDQTCITVLILDTPIIWDNVSVDVVALLMIREKDSAYVEPFMNLLMKGIEDKSWFISKMMEVK